MARLWLIPLAVVVVYTLAHDQAAAAVIAAALAGWILGADRSP